MKWTQLRAAVLAFVAPSLRKRIDLQQARYRRTKEETGRVWLTLDKRELVSFGTESYVGRRAELTDQARAGEGPFALSASSDHAEFLASDAAIQDHLLRAGLQDDYVTLRELEAYLSLSIDAALTAPYPLTRALAVIDRRIGKRRLRQLATAEGLHPLVEACLGARVEAEGLDRPSSSTDGA